MNIDNAPKPLQRDWLVRQLSNLVDDARRMGFDVFVSTIIPSGEILRVVDKPSKRVD